MMPTIVKQLFVLGICFTRTAIRCAGFQKLDCLSICRNGRLPRKVIHRLDARTTSVNTDRIGAISLAGSDPNRPQKVNQDTFFSGTVRGKPNDHDNGYEEEFGVACVMDGHGRRAEELTSFLKTHLFQCIQDQLQKPHPMQDLQDQIQRLARVSTDQQTMLQDPVSVALVNAFHQSHWDAMQNAKVPAGRCGTTCIVALWNHNHIYVAHVGDSQIYGYDSQSQELQALSTPTTVKNMPQEKQRIESSPESRIDGNGNVWYGPIGIAMTRALGDAVMLRAGVVPTPIIERFPRQTIDRLVLATDGVWDAISLKQVKEVVMQQVNLSPQEAAEILAEESREGWRKKSPGLVDEPSYDDITAVVVALTS